MDVIIFCLVEFDDFDEIVKFFKGIYEGYDYLLLKFYKWF